MSRSRRATAGEDADRIQVGQRIWLHRGGRQSIGMGTFQLLTRVESTGSLNRAAAEMGMAYSKAWHSVRLAEATVGYPLLDRQTGGRGGGGSTLSPQGKWLVAAFGALLQDATEAIRALGEKHLRDWPGAGDPGPGEPVSGQADPAAPPAALE